MDYRELAQRIAIEEGIDPDLFLRLVNQESRFNADARSPVGAIGLAQLMPGTAEYLGVDPYDPEQNLRGGARYLREQLERFGRVDYALAAYNAGPGRVQQYGGIPPFRETQNYVRTIMGASAPTVPQPAPSAGRPGGATPNPMLGIPRPEFPAQPPTPPQSTWLDAANQFAALARGAPIAQGYDPYAIANMFGRPQ